MDEATPEPDEDPDGSIFGAAYNQFSRVRHMIMYHTYHMHPVPAPRMPTIHWRN